ncbi:MAG: AAA family ATPase, partial [Nanoarchaeota archaeon]|nr:AAA family ATPase [Nanoarchaeota archaeon]
MGGTFRSFLMALFTVTYAPKNSTEIVGQEEAVTALKTFIQSYRQQKQKAALLHGPIGTGKTSAVYALAQELQADVLELNSSDLRNADALSSFLNAALGQQSLFMRPKIILIDEVDNISGVQDRGGIPALLSAIEKSV